MNHRLHENMELAGLAHRRYPDMSLILALECFLSDRRRAGLGALDERQRRGRGEIRNRKWIDWIDEGRVRYELTIDRPERRRYPKVPLPDLGDFNPLATVTLEIVPAKVDLRCLPVGHDMLREQRGRRFIAQELRKVRRDMRKGSP